MRLHPWYGPGGHPECPEDPASQIAFGKYHDYRCYPKDGAFVAEQRPKGGTWTLLSDGHKNAYAAGTACAVAERDHTVRVEHPELLEEEAVVAGTTFERLLEEQPGAEVLVMTAPTKKLSAVDQLKARRQART